MFFEKATKFEKPLKMEIYSNFVAFSKYMNFKIKCDFIKSLTQLSIRKETKGGKKFQ